MAAGNNHGVDIYTNKEYISPYCYPSENPPQYRNPSFWNLPFYYLPQQQQQVLIMREKYLQQQREQEERRARQHQQEQVLWEQLQRRRRQREEEEEERLKIRRQNFVEYCRDKEESRPYSRFLSFLEYEDDSFLAPWHWNPHDHHAPPAASTSGPKSYMKIETGSYFANDHARKISKIAAEPVPSDLLGQNVSRTDEERVRDEYVDDDHKPSNINVKQASDDTLDDHSRIDVEEVSQSFFKRLDQIKNSLDRNPSSTIDVEEASLSFLERLDRNNVDPRKLRKHKRDL